MLQDSWLVLSKVQLDQRSYFHGKRKGHFCDVLRSLCCTGMKVYRYSLVCSGEAAVSQPWLLNIFFYAEITWWVQYGWNKRREQKLNTIFLEQKVAGLAHLFFCGICLCYLMAKWRILSCWVPYLLLSVHTITPWFGLEVCVTPTLPWTGTRSTVQSTLEHFRDDAATASLDN